MTETTETAATIAPDKDESLTKHIPLFREIGNTKRIRAAESNDSIAARMFERAWGRINGGEAIRSVAVGILAEMIPAARLGAIDRAILRSAELSDAEIEIVLRRAFDSFSTSLDKNLKIDLRREIGAATRRQDDEIFSPAAEFVERLKRQPRPGATKTGAPKRLFDQPENHAEHCLSVAVGGALLAAHFRANFETVFLIGLIHHFHNAYLPDAGFAGEEAHGEFLPRVINSFRRRCLAEVPENLHEKILNCFEIIENADQPEAKAFHAADVFDRVLQMRHHAEATEFTLRYALEEVELVHEGTARNFHFDVLRQAGLIE